MKTTYETPTVADLGTFENITLGSSTGSNFDASFDAGQPAPDPLDIFS